MQESSRIQNEISLSPRESSPKHTVLLVEDEELVRELLSEVMRRAGYEVIACAHPQEGIELSGQHLGHIDLLLTDIVMPGMNGREMAAEVQRRIPGVRVLFMSGYTEHSLMQDGQLDPEIEYLQKPFSLQTLTQRLEQLLGGAVH